MIPDSIGRYRNLQRIGRGGMGEIYRAEDPGLKRNVALKFISPECVADASARSRLIREARAAASLSHPFVCTVHEVLDAGDQPVIVMELVSGETLHDRLLRGPMAVAEIITIGGEILEAIAAAHDLGIIHRDIKSANVMLTASGHVKVMDFGLATSGGPVTDNTETVEQLTARGAIGGTVTHMAPELLLGGGANVATDLYAFGVTLYEMCAGRLPFTGASSPAVVAEVLKGNEPPPSRYNTAIPGPLDEVVMRLIDRDPARRPPDARAAREMLQRTADGSIIPRGGERSIAVLPFRAIVSDAETEMLGIALADATIAELSLLRSLTVRPTAAVLGYKDATEPAKAGKELGVEAVVHGTFQRSGSRLRVTVQLIKTTEARAMWATKIDTSLDDIFATQDEVSRRIAEALDIQLSPADERRLSRVAQPAGAAYEAYLGGFVHLLRETLPDTHAAIDAFRKAVEIDPDFALGWVALAEAYATLGYAFDPDPQWFRRAAELTDRAIAIDPKLPEARYLQGRLNWNPAGGWDHVAAIRNFAAAIAGNPNLAQAHMWLALVLVHVGLFDESLMHLRRAIDIVPDNWNAKVSLSWFLLLEGRFEEALEITTEFARRFPGHEAYYSMANVHLREPRVALAEEVAERATREFPKDVYFHPVLAIIAAMRGDVAGLQANVDATLANSHAFGHFHHAQYDIACAYAIAGNVGEAVRWLRDSAQNGNPCATMIERDPLLASIRDSDELRPLLAELHEQQERYALAYRDAMTRPLTQSRP